MKTREEWREWALSLKPGDKVINADYSWREKVRVETVEKITPSGMVRTNIGMYAQTKYWEKYRERGKTRGFIQPATPELIQEAERQAVERERRKEMNDTIVTARSKCYNLCYGRTEMPYEMAVELLELVKKYEQKSEA